MLWQQRNRASKSSLKLQLPLLNPAPAPDTALQCHSSSRRGIQNWHLLFFKEAGKLWAKTRHFQESWCVSSPESPSESVPLRWRSSADPLAVGCEAVRTQVDTTHFCNKWCNRCSDSSKTKKTIPFCLLTPEVEVQGCRLKCTHIFPWFGTSCWMLGEEDGGKEPCCMVPGERWHCHSATVSCPEAPSLCNHLIIAEVFVLLCYLQGTSRESSSEMIMRIIKGLEHFSYKEGLRDLGAV